MEIADRMSVSVKAAGKGGHRHDRPAAEVQVRVQHDAQPDGPGAAAAIAGEGLKLFPARQVDRLALVLSRGTVRIAQDELAFRRGRIRFGPALLPGYGLLRRSFCEDRRRKACEKHRKRAEKRQQRMERVAFILHGPVPPFPAARARRKSARPSDCRSPCVR